MTTGKSSTYNPYSLLTVPEAALLWAGATEEEVKRLFRPYLYDDSDSLHVCPLTQDSALGRAKLLFVEPGDAERFPDFLAYQHAIHAAIDSNELPATRRDGAAANYDRNEHIAPDRRCVFVGDLKNWIAANMPDAKPAFLFSPAEREKPAFLTDGKLARLKRRYEESRGPRVFMTSNSDGKTWLQEQVVYANRYISELEKHYTVAAELMQRADAALEKKEEEARLKRQIDEKDELIAKLRDDLSRAQQAKQFSASGQQDQLNQKTERAYQNLIEVLRQILTGDENNTFLQGATHTQAEIVKHISEKYKDFFGLSERTVNARFSESRKNFKRELSR